MRNLPPALAFLLVVLRPAVLLGYRVVTRLAARYLGRGLCGASVYVAGSGASGDLAVGLSDIDLVAVLGGRPDTVEHHRDVVLSRWRRLQRAFGPLAGGIGIAVYAESDLADEPGATALTYGLAGRAAVPSASGGYLRPGRPVDDLYRRLHPGVYGPGRTWRLVDGSCRTRGDAIGSPDYRRLAAWLELQWWWRFASELSTSPHPAFASYLAFKLVAEPVRIWLWLAHGIRVNGRLEAIEHALTLLPEEDDVLRSALTLYNRLPRAGEPPRAETLAWLLRIGDRIAALLEAEILVRDASEVSLVTGDAVLRREASEALQGLSSCSPVLRCAPLADWRSRSMPPLADEALVAVDIDVADPVALGGLSEHAVVGLQPAVRTERLLVLPGDAFSDRVLMRSIQFAGSDPVSFALLDGRETASFPQVPGLSASDCARRAVDEHAAWLSLWIPKQPLADVTLDRLFTAARAALFSESIHSGEPQLPLSARSTVACLGDRYAGARSTAEDAYAAFRDHRANGKPAPPGVAAAFRRVVENLVSYGAAP